MNPTATTTEDEPALDLSQGSSSWRIFVVLRLFVVVCKRVEQCPVGVVCLFFTWGGGCWCMRVFFPLCNLVWLLSTLFLLRAMFLMHILLQSSSIQLLRLVVSFSLEWVRPYSLILWDAPICTVCKETAGVLLEPPKDQQKCLCQCSFGKYRPRCPMFIILPYNFGQSPLYSYHASSHFSYSPVMVKEDRKDWSDQVSGVESDPKETPRETPKGSPK